MRYNLQPRVYNLRNVNPRRYRQNNNLEIQYEPLPKATNIYDRNELNILRTHTCNFLKLIYWLNLHTLNNQH